MKAGLAESKARHKGWRRRERRAVERMEGRQRHGQRWPRVMSEEMGYKGSLECQNPTP